MYVRLIAALFSSLPTISKNGFIDLNTLAVCISFFLVFLIFISMEIKHSLFAHINIFSRIFFLLLFLLMLFVGCNAIINSNRFFSVFAKHCFGLMAKTIEKLVKIQFFFLSVVHLSYRIVIKFLH